MRSIIAIDQGRTVGPEAVTASTLSQGLSTQPKHDGPVIFHDSRDLHIIAVAVKIESTTGIPIIDPLSVADEKTVIAITRPVNGRCAFTKFELIPAHQSFFDREDRHGLKAPGWSGDNPVVCDCIHTPVMNRLTDKFLLRILIGRSGGLAQQFQGVLICPKVHIISIRTKSRRPTERDALDIDKIGAVGWSGDTGGISCQNKGPNIAGDEAFRRLDIDAPKVLLVGNDALNSVCAGCTFTDKCQGIEFGSKVHLIGSLNPSPGQRAGCDTNRTVGRLGLKGFRCHPGGGNDIPPRDSAIVDPHLVHQTVKVINILGRIADTIRQMDTKIKRFVPLGKNELDGYDLFFEVLNETDFLRIGDHTHIGPLSPCSINGLINIECALHLAGAHGTRGIVRIRRIIQVEPMVNREP